MKTRFHCCTLLLLLLACAAQSQTVPALVNYQGRLANPDGTALATGDYQLTLRVYDSATNTGGLIWGPQIFDGANAQGHGGRIPVVQGYFNVMLGPVDTNGVSLANAFSATNRYVEIRVGTNNPILPRQQILSAPYALNSAKLAGADWSAVFGTNDPVNGRIPTTKLATNGTIIAEQVGIGLTSPTAPLHVKGTGGGFGGIFESTPGINSLTLLSHNGGANYGSYLDFTDNSTISASIRSVASGGLRFTTAGTEWVTIAGDGKVGIGTISPAYRLDVNGDIRASGSVRTSGGTGWYNETYGGGWNMSDTIWVRSLNNKGVWLGSGLFGSDGGLTIGYGGAAPPNLGAVISGNVGIGTMTPQKKLHVNGDIVLGVDTLTGGYTGLEIGLSSISGGYARLQAIKQSGSSFGDLILQPGGGSVGIGTTTPTLGYALAVNGHATATSFNPPSDRNMKENFAPVTPREVLDKVSIIPISRWNFKGDTATPHLGPMAQDFYAAFGLGTDDRHIATVDADGVALAAIQGLNQKLEEKLKEKDARIDLLEKRLNELERNTKSKGEKIEHEH